MAQCCGRTAGLRCRCSWQAQVAGNGQGGFGAVQGVEMQAGGALVEQVLAQAADDVFAECADGGFVVSEFGESKPYPSRHFSTTHVRESKQLGAVGNWHDARHDGHGDAAGANAVDEIEVGVGVEEVLGDGAVGAGLYFFDKVPEVGRSVAGLGMHFGVRGNFYVKPVAGGFADEADQLAGVMQFAGVTAHARGQVASQGDKSANATLFVCQQDIAQFGAAGTDAGKMGAAS